MDKTFLGRLLTFLGGRPAERVESMDILNQYVLSSPKDQNVLDIFAGQWSSRIPDEYGLDTQPGMARLFEDDRVIWVEETFGSFSNWNVLELGPLEGGHAYMFQNRGAKKVISVEANTRAYLKCLCVKEIFKLDRVEFKLGDFVSYLETEVPRFDLVFASGVLYHMEEPLKLLKLISRVSNRLFIWTHYFDQELISERGHLKQKFSSLTAAEFEGLAYEYSTQAYQDDLEWRGFCGGPKPVSKWLTRKSILSALDEFGFEDIQINFDHHDHPNGPAFAICAQK